MERVKKLRLERGLTQQQLADNLGIDRTAVVKYETGRNGPTSEMLQRISDFFGVTVDYLLGREPIPGGAPAPSVSGGRWVPVLGSVRAGIPIEAVEDVLDYEEISPELAASGEHFALKVRGDSMSPVICDGDVVIVRQQDDAETGDTCVVLVNGSEATVKKIKKGPEGLMLIPNNTIFEPMFYTQSEIASLPVRIVGKVVELRRKL